MLKNKKSFLNKFKIAKNEFVSMKLHFRYHTYLSNKEGNFEDCRYCNDRLEKDNGGLLKTKVEKVKKSEVTLMQTKNKKAQIKRNQL
jgi:hypothetical protein